MKNGFTLIEILIYTFLLSLTISFIIGILTNFFLFRGIFLTREEVARSIPYVLENITREIREADEIIYPKPAKPSSQLLLKENGEDLLFQLKDGIIIEEVEGKVFSLTPANLNIRNLRFSLLKQSPDSPSSVQINIGLSYRNPLNLKGYDFSTFYQTSAFQRK